MHRHYFVIDYFLVRPTAHYFLDSVEHRFVLGYFLGCCYFDYCRYSGYFRFLDRFAVDHLLGFLDFHLVDFDLSFECFIGFCAF